jgi:hypothetical protein
MIFRFVTRSPADSPSFGATATTLHNMTFDYGISFL